LPCPQPTHIALEFLLATNLLEVPRSNGFQVWEVMDSMPDSTEATRQTQPLRELASVRQGYTKLIKVLQSSPVSDRSPLYGMQPAVAVVGGNTDDDLKVLQIYSLREASYVYSLRFHGEVHGVASSPTWFAVCLKNQVPITLHSFTLHRSGPFCNTILPPSLPLSLSPSLPLSL